LKEKEKENNKKIKLNAAAVYTKNHQREKNVLIRFQLKKSHQNDSEAVSFQRKKTKSKRFLLGLS
jgi:hypothetical protein